MAADAGTVEVHLKAVVDKAEAGFVKREPAVAGSIAAAVIAYVVRALLTHGVIGSTVASSLTQQLDPLLTGLLIVALGFVLRHFVTPAGAFAEHVMDEVAQRLDGAVGAGLTSMTTSSAQPVTVLPSLTSGFIAPTITGHAAQPTAPADPPPAPVPAVPVQGDPTPTSPAV